jgi:hypothetical protein
MDLGNYSEWPKVAGAVIKAASEAALSDSSRRVHRRHKGACASDPRRGWAR